MPPNDRGELLYARHSYGFIATFCLDSGGVVLLVSLKVSVPLRDAFQAEGLKKVRVQNLPSLQQQRVPQDLDETHFTAATLTLGHSRFRADKITSRRFQG